MTLSRKYKPGSRQNFSFQNRILYKKAQCCGELPWLAPTCDNFPIVPIVPSGYICYGTQNTDRPEPDDLTITIGNNGPGQATGNNYELYFGLSLINSWVNAPATVDYTFINYDFATQNGIYTLIITNFLGCTETVEFEILGVPRPQVLSETFDGPDGPCVGCVDPSSLLVISILQPFPGAQYTYVLKGSTTGCVYNSGITGPVYNFTNICGDNYGFESILYIDGQEICEFATRIDFI